MEVEKEKKKKEETDQDETKKGVSMIPGNNSMYGEDNGLGEPWIKLFSTNKPVYSDIKPFFKSEFEYRGIHLPISAKVSAINKNRWEIVDGEKKYKIEKRGKQLDIYMYSEIGGRL